MKTPAFRPALSGGRATGGGRIPTRPAKLKFINGSSPRHSPSRMAGLRGRRTDVRPVGGKATATDWRQCQDAPEPATVRSAGLQPALRVHFGQAPRKQPPYTTSGSGKPVTDRSSGRQCRHAGAGGGRFVYGLAPNWQRFNLLRQQPPSITMQTYQTKI